VNEFEAGAILSHPVGPRYQVAIKFGERGRILQIIELFIISPHELRSRLQSFAEGFLCRDRAI
jgi:hypothetical protein